MDWTKLRKVQAYAKSLGAGNLVIVKHAGSKTYNVIHAGKPAKHGDKFYKVI